MSVNNGLKSKYRDQEAKFYSGQYYDSSYNSCQIFHGNTKALFATLARDLKLLENATTDIDSDAVTASLIKAFTGNEVTSLKYQYEDEGEYAEADVLELIMKQLEI